MWIHPHLYKLLLTFSNSQCYCITTVQAISHLKVLNHIPVREICWFSLNNWNKMVWLMKKVSSVTFLIIASDLIHSRTYHWVKYNTDLFLQKTVTACRYLNSSFLKPAGDRQKERQTIIGGFVCGFFKETLS